MKYVTLAIALLALVSSPVRADEPLEVPPVLNKALLDCGSPEDCRIKTQFIVEAGVRKEVPITSVTSPSMRTIISCGQRTGIVGNLKVGKQVPEVLVCKDPASGIALTVGNKDGKFLVPRVVFVPWNAEDQTLGEPVVLTAVEGSKKVDEKGNLNLQFLPANEFDLGYFVVGWGDPTAAQKE